MKFRNRTTRHGLLFAAIAIALTLCAGSALAEDVTQPSAQLSITIPDGWTGTARDVIQLDSPEEDAWIYFWALNAADYESAIKSPKEWVGTLVENAKVSGKAKGATLNGLDAARFKGKGALGEFKVVFHGAIVKSEGSPGIIVIVTSKDGWKAHKDTFEATLESVKKTAAPE